MAGVFRHAWRPPQKRRQVTITAPMVFRRSSRPPEARQWHPPQKRRYYHLIMVMPNIGPGRLLQATRTRLLWPQGILDGRILGAPRVRLLSLTRLRYLGQVRTRFLGKGGGRA
jgi:hypothetical protein